MANTIDIVIALLLVVGIVRGLYIGVIQQIGGIVALVVAIVGARLFARPCVEPFLQKIIELPAGSYHPVSYCVAFLVFFLAVVLLAKVLKKLTHLAHLGLLDRVLGALFCPLRYLFLLSVLLNLAQVLDPQSALISQDVKQKSHTYTWVLGFAKEVLSLNVTEIADGLEQNIIKHSPTNEN